MKFSFFAAILEVLVTSTFPTLDMSSGERGLNGRKAFRFLGVKEDLHVRGPAFPNFFADDAICAFTDAEILDRKKLLFIVVIDGEAPLLSFIIVTGTLLSSWLFGFAFDILGQVDGVVSGAA